MIDTNSLRKIQRLMDASRSAPDGDDSNERTIAHLLSISGEKDEVENTGLPVLNPEL